MLSRPHHITGSGADGFGGVALYIYPSFLQFYEDDVDSHSQAATVFNPYEFTVKYKGNCTNEIAFYWSKTRSNV